jgi:SAM-dependent methyltransferase
MQDAELDGNPDDYLVTNLANWNSRVPFHEQGYGLDAFRDDPSHISTVVQFDLPRLPPVAGLDVVHLQCHIGTDTLSLARLGARMTGLDFSAPALDVARRLAADCGAEITYVESDLYGAVDALGGERFDLVFTGVGALCWLPDVRRWAQVVAALLRPGGRLFIREGHPVLWALCEPRPDGLIVLDYPYFEVPGGTPFSDATTYVEHEGELASPDIVHFNHGIGEIITAVMDAGLTLTSFEEHRSVPWNPLADEFVQVHGLEEFELRDRPERLAASYTLQAVKGAPATLAP